MAWCEDARHLLDAVLEEGAAARIVLLDGPRVLGWKDWREIDASTGGRSLREGIEAAMKARQIGQSDGNALATLISGALNEAAMLCIGNPARMRKSVRAALRRLLDGLRV